MYSFQSKHFECHCKKCEDPTELGSYGGSIKCLKCEKGFLMSPKWKCNHCANEIPSEIGEALILKAYKESEELFSVKSNRTIEKYEEYITKYNQTLHPGTIHELIQKFF